jgi:hypothetical protein
MTIAIPPPPRSVLVRAGTWLRDNLASRRSRFLIAALAFIVGASGLTLLDATDFEVLRTLSERQTRLARIEQLGKTDLWHQRRSETDPLRVQAEARLWEAETDGIAQANFQSWIIEQANRAGIGRVEVRTSINASANNQLKLREISAQVSGQFVAAGFFKYLQAVAGDDRLLFIDRLEIRTGPVPHFEMVLATFLRPARTS